MHPFDDAPTCRATIRGGTLTLNRWRPGMGPRGPLKAGYAHVTAVLADLHRLDDGELLVRPVRGVPWDDAAADVLLAWAGRIGYERVWLPGRVVALGDVLAEDGWAEATCPGCGAVWEDGGPEFWEDVRRDGWFPGSCLACGASLPEWSPVSDRSAPVRPSSRTAIPGGTPCT